MYSSYYGNPNPVYPQTVEPVIHHPLYYEQLCQSRTRAHSPYAQYQQSPNQSYIPNNIYSQTIQQTPINQPVVLPQPTLYSSTIQQVQGNQIPIYQTQCRVASPMRQSNYIEHQSRVQYQPAYQLQDYIYPTISHNIGLPMASDTYKYGDFTTEIKPRTIYDYGEDQSYYATYKKNRTVTPQAELQEVPTITMSKKGGEEKISLENKFSDLRDSLQQSNIYTYMQMVDNVVLCFKEQIMCEREINIHKNQILQRSEFEIRKLFSLFTKDDKFVTLAEFYEGITGIIGLYEAKIHDMELLFKRYAIAYANKKKMSYEEFRQLFSCENIPEKSEGEDQEDLSPITMNILNRFFKMLLVGENSLEQARQKMRNKLCNFSYVFDYIDRKHNGLISESDLRVLLQNTGKEFELNQLDIERLLKRFDRNQDGVIDLTEFIYQFQPKSQAILVEKDKN